MTLAMNTNGSVATAVTPPMNELAECDACPCCSDTCDDNEFCVFCQKKCNSSKLTRRRKSETSWLMDALSIMLHEKQQPNTYTMCQLRRHNHVNSAWILVGTTIYDATPYIRSHPGGTQTILRKSGGAADCSEDLQFHSKRSQKEWKKYKVGTLCRCHMFGK